MGPEEERHKCLSGDSSNNATTILLLLKYILTYLLTNIPKLKLGLFYWSTKRVY